MTAVNEAASTGVAFSTILDSGLFWRVATTTGTGPFSVVFTEGGDIDYLIIGAGGSGAWARGGGGGAGALLQGTTTIAAGTISGSVGVGGAALTAAGQGNDGGATNFGALTALGGGGGGRSLSNAAQPGSPGGSGGGGGGGDVAVGNPAGGAGNTGGNAGGAGMRNATAANRHGGGGGGAGGPGGDATTAAGGTGGPGVTSAINGTATVYAAGGRGDGAAVPAGATNPGSGGRGIDTTGTSGAGQNGIVIIRWQIPITGPGALQIAAPRVAGAGSIPLVGETLTVPSGWDGIAPSFAIRRTGLRRYEHSFDVLGEMAASDVTYYVSPTGNDAYSGLSPFLAKKSVNALIVALNASPPSIGATIILAPGVYSLGDAPVTNITFPCNLVCEDGRAQFWNQSANAWFKVGGLTNVYDSGASSGARPAVIDLSVLDSRGRPRRYRQVADAATCDATPGSIFLDTNSTKIHCFGSRAPDASVVRLSGATSWTQTSPVRVYLRNIDFWGSTGRPATYNPTGTNGRICFDRCSFRYSWSSENGVETPAGDVSHRIIFFQCDASYNSFDGFSYRGSVTGYEIECIAEWNGYSQQNASDNGSTAHQNAKTLRINGTYAYNDDRNIHDIDTTRNWIIGCQAGFAQNGDSNTYNNTAFMAGRETFSDNTRTWLDGCTSLGGVASDAASYGTSVMNAIDCAGLTTRVTDGTATINLSTRDDSRTGTGAVSIAGPQSAGSGTVSAGSFTGSAAVSIARPTVAGSGTVTPPAISGAGAVQIARPTLAAAGTVTPPAITGAGAVQIAAPTLVGAGSVAGPGGVSGSATISIGAPQVAGAGTVIAPGAAGVGAVAIGPPAVAASGTVTVPAITGAAAVSISGPVVSGFQAPNSAGRVAVPGEAANGGALAGSRRSGRLV